MKKKYLIFIYLIILSISVFMNLKLSKQNKVINDKCTAVEISNINLSKENKRLYNLISTLSYELNTNSELNQEMKCDEVSEILSCIEELKQTDKKLYLNIFNQLVDISQIDVEGLSNYFNEEQIEIMYRCIETETYGAPFNAKVNVASVILNRVESDMFPTDPIEIIKSPNQFSYSKRNISEETKLSLEYAFLFGSDVEDCVAFRSDCNPSKWCNWEYQYTDEVGHHFYK